MIDFSLCEIYSYRAYGGANGSKICIIYNDVLDAIKQQQLIDPAIVLQFFWRIFTADAFLGNFDRHNGNWGFLINETDGKIKLAPIYDCASCLFPQADEAIMQRVLTDPKELEERTFVFPVSVLKQKGKRINYYQLSPGGNRQPYAIVNPQTIARLNSIAKQVIHMLKQGTRFIPTKPDSLRIERLMIEDTPFLKKSPKNKLHR